MCSLTHNIYIYIYIIVLIKLNVSKCDKILSINFFSMTHFWCYGYLTPYDYIFFFNLHVLLHQINVKAESKVKHAKQTKCVNIGVSLVTTVMLNVD